MKNTGTCISLIPASPGEIKAGGAGEGMQWGLADSPFGSVFVAEGWRGITHLSFFDDDRQESLDVLRRDWPKANLIRNDKLATGLSHEIFRGKSGRKFQLHVIGTPFQQEIWKALLEIPEGSVSTYGGLAAAIGMKGASRAVGNAVGANRISYLIPCHRVIRSDGELGGYRWGTERKRIMLRREQ